MHVEDTIVIDVRRPKDYELSHINGAVLGDKRTIHKEVNLPNQSSPILCYCYMGVSSKVACRNLTKAGFDRVLNLKGGYAAWNKAFPEKKG